MQILYLHNCLVLISIWHSPITPVNRLHFSICGTLPWIANLRKKARHLQNKVFSARFESRISMGLRTKSKLLSRNGSWLRPCPHRLCKFHSTWVPFSFYREACWHHDDWPTTDRAGKRWHWFWIKSMNVLFHRKTRVMALSLDAVKWYDEAWGHDSTRF